MIVLFTCPVYLYAVLLKINCFAGLVTAPLPANEEGDLAATNATAADASLAAKVEAVRLNKRKSVDFASPYHATSSPIQVRNTRLGVNLRSRKGALHFIPIVHFASLFHYFVT